MLTKKYINQLVHSALLEDIGREGDITSKVLIPKSSLSKATIVVKEKAVICGTEFAKQAFKKLDKSVKIRTLKKDGFLAGDIAMIGTGNFMINVVKDHTEKVDAGFTAFMGSDGSRNSAFIGGDLIAIPVTTGAKEAALEYIEYVLSEAGQIEVYTKNGGIPIRADLFEGNPYLTDDHMVFANASTVGDVPYTTVYQELMDPWQVANQRIFAGEDVQTVLDEQTAIMQKIIDAGH